MLLLGYFQMIVYMIMYNSWIITYIHSLPIGSDIWKATPENSLPGSAGSSAQSRSQGGGKIEELERYQNSEWKD